MSILVNAFQHGTLQRVAKAIWTHIFDVEALKNLHMHICSEEYPDVEKLDEKVESLERDWPPFAGPDRVALGVLPADLTSTTGDAMLCYGKSHQIHRWSVLNVWKLQKTRATASAPSTTVTYDSYWQGHIATFTCLRRKAVFLYLLVD